jgi:hypothetical protein
MLGAAGNGLSAGGGSVLARTSLTIHWRERTLTNWPCSGGETTPVPITSPLPGGSQRSASGFPGATAESAQDTVD